MIGIFIGIWMQFAGGDIGGGGGTNRELREDGSIELREDGSIELRE